MRRRATLTARQQHELQSFIKDAEKVGEIRRAQAVWLYHDQASMGTIMAVTRYSERHIHTLAAGYKDKGLSVLKDRRQAAPKELLTKKQRIQVVELVIKKTPEDFGYETPYWTTGILGKVIEEKYKVKYKSKTSYYLLFRRAKFSFHLPPTRYREQDAKEVALWRKAARKRIARAWDDPKTVLLAGDEMVLTTATTTQKVWLPQGAGEVPVVEVSNSGRKRRNIYGFLDLKTGTEHAWKTNFQNMHVTVKILKKLRRKYPEQHILLLWDSAGWHKGSKVQEYVKEDGNIEILHFPRYAPEENPQEHVWKNGRSAVTHNRFIEDIDEATDEFVKYIRNTTFAYRLFDFTAIS